MINFFDKFKDLEMQNDAVIDVVDTPNISVILTFEQPLFYRAADAEQARIYKQLQRISHGFYDRKGNVYTTLDDELEKLEDIAKLVFEEKSFEKEMFSSNHSYGSDEYNALGEKRDELQKYIRQVKDMRMKDSQFKDLNRRYGIAKDNHEKFSGLVKDFPLIVTPESPIDTLKIFGVLDYSQDPNYDTWDERKTGPCIRYLTDKLLDDLSDFDNDKIDNIILFSGLHAGDHPYDSASRIVRERNFDPGIVKVFHTGFHVSYAHDNVGIVKNEREGLVKFMESLGMSDDLVRLDICPGPTISHYLKEMNRE